MHKRHILCALSLLIAFSQALAMNDNNANDNNAPAPNRSYSSTPPANYPYLSDEQMLLRLAERSQHNRRELEQLAANEAQRESRQNRTQLHSSHNDNNASAPYSNDPIADARIARFVARANKCLEYTRNDIHSQIPANSALTVRTDEGDDTITLQTALQEISLSDIEERRERVRNGMDIVDTHSSLAFEAKYSYETPRNLRPESQLSAQAEPLEDYKRNVEFESLLERSRKAVEKVRQATDSVYETYGYGSIDYTIEEDYREPRATYKKSVSVHFFDNDDNSHNNNSPEQAVAPHRITDANQLLKIELEQNPTQSYELFVRFFMGNPARYDKIDMETGDTALHKAVKIAIDKKDVTHAQITLVSIAAALAAGANKEARNIDGKTPLDLAMESEHLMLVQLLTMEQPTKEALVNLVTEYEMFTLLNYLID